eukprot:COSAG01_NODE_46512_length_399_cov_1.616667_1_plen_56_part_10
MPTGGGGAGAGRGAVSQNVLNSVLAQFCARAHRAVSQPTVRLIPRPSCAMGVGGDN